MRTDFKVWGEGVDRRGIFLLLEWDGEKGDVLHDGMRWSKEGSTKKEHGGTTAEPRLVLVEKYRPVYEGV
jgi:hypothetical protein